MRAGVWCVWATLLGLGLALKQQIYHNEFAVHVPDGAEHVDRISAKHGFINHGQIGSLKGYYLLSHHEVRKRSLNASIDHHMRLTREPQVRWVMQQHERRRLKRDYTPLEGESLWSGPRHRNYHRALVQTNPYFPDPLYKEQWYLNGGAKDGLDMNVGPAWARGYTGKGVVVSILDDGIQTNHPDLAQNYDPGASTDINDNDEDPTPRDNGDNKHGTRCAGEVAAVAYNLICGVGVAYNASVGGVRMLDGIVNDAVEARALGLNPDHVDIYSASWGPEDDGKTVDGPGPLARRAFIYGVTSGRRGKGSIFVWASGNGGRHTDSCNCDGYTNSIFTLSISSATQGGYKPWYLEECSSTLASTYSSGTPGHDKSVATVDMDGRLRPDHICTVEHTGTSASAPLAAGICALALEANPELTWRDMQYLVVMTSRAAPLEKETGWITNGVKRKVSHKFGYGLMDAAEMVSLAERWTSVPPQHICKSQEIIEDHAIEPTYGYTMTTHMDVSGCRGTVNEVRHLEHVQCKISLRFFPRGNLRILLTSPAGTASTLLFERPRDVVSSNFDDWPFLSVHFWGERADGRWTLEVVNAGNRHVNQPGILKKWQLIFYGTNVDPVRLRKAGSGGAVPAFAFPTAGDVYEPSVPAGDPFYSSETYANYQNYPLFAAGSEPEKAVAALDGSPAPMRSSLEDLERKIQHDCDSECDKMCYGVGPTQCVTCKNFRLEFACVSRCPPRSYIGPNKECKSCHSACDTCAGPGQDACLSCAEGHLLIADLAICVQQCPDGYYEESGQCRSCAPHCASCTDKTNACTACEHHLVLVNGNCLAACPAGTYETEDESCASCDASCESCSGPGTSDCVQCKVSHFSLEGSCVTTCPANHYPDKKRKECIACELGCMTCSSTGCVECERGWTLNKKGRCVPQGNDRCQPGEYFSSESSTCEACAPQCASCTQQACLSCRAPLLLQEGACVPACGGARYAEGGRCAQCPHSCARCASRLNCTACAGELRLQGGTCVAHCAKGYYADRDSCAKCHLSCDTCSGGRRDQCVTCPTGWRLAAGECHPECPEGFYELEGGCHKCHHYCRACKGSGPLQCTSCPTHSALLNSTCVECESAQFYDVSSHACAQCHGTCHTCYAATQFSCASCEQPLRLDRLNNQCVPCCSEELDNETSTAPAPAVAPDCCRCDNSGECRHSSAAGKRRIAEAAPYRADATDSSSEGGSRVHAAWLALAAGGFAAAGAVMIFTVLQRMTRDRPRESRYARVACDADLSLTDAHKHDHEHEHEPLLEAYT